MNPPPLIFQSQLLLDERVQQEWLVCETINGHGFHRDHLNPSREEAGTLHVSHVTEPHYTRASACRSLSLSSVYYTGLRGEIDLKWQLLGPNSRRAALTRMQQHQSHLPEVKTRVYHGHHLHVRFIWHLVGFIFGKRKDFFLRMREDDDYLNMSDNKTGYIDYLDFFISVTGLSIRSQ